MQRQPLYFFNTLTQEKEEFAPLKKDTVLMYNCGPTVYDRTTIGNMRSYVLADLIRRVLEYNDYDVTQVINITDVGHLTSDADAGEDKLEKRAQERGESVQAIAKQYTDAFFKDIERLNINAQGVQFPRATEYVQEQIALVQTLEEKGYAYKTSDGMYFDTSLFSNYGNLGNIAIEGLEEGARVEKNPEKRNLTDFALWKFSKDDEKREQEWDSPWGVGFPGWHIECSAIIRALLGKQIDIHTGGVDHIPVHHNNEIAQSECSTGKKPFVHYWLHNAFITIEGRKISKSIGNTINLDQVIDRKFSPLAYRYWLLTAHYRTPANFTWEALEGAQTALTRLHRYFVDELSVTAIPTAPEAYQSRFQKAVNDDLDTPKALALLWELVKDTQISKEKKRATLLDMDRVLGLGLSESADALQKNLAGEAIRVAISDIPDEVQKLLQEREEARSSNEYAQADLLRTRIAELGFHVEDTPEGPRISERS